MPNFRSQKPKPQAIWLRIIQRLDQPWKRVAGIIGVILVIVFLSNIPFFWANIKFVFHKTNLHLSDDLKKDKPANKIEPNTLIVDSLGIKVPVVYVSDKTEKAWQEGLKNGVVHYEGTAKPGEYGNVYIFGHSSDYAWSGGHYKTVFALLPRIHKDDEIILSDWTGNVYKYKVVETKVVSPDDTSVLDQQHFQRKLLTLQTSYPIGTALKRYIVIAEIMEPKSNTVPQVGT